MRNVKIWKAKQVCVTKLRKWGNALYLHPGLLVLSKRPVCPFLYYSFCDMSSMFVFRGRCNELPLATWLYTNLLSYSPVGQKFEGNLTGLKSTCSFWRLRGRTLPGLSWVLEAAALLWCVVPFLQVRSQQWKMKLFSHHHMTSLYNHISLCLSSSATRSHL